MVYSNACRNGFVIMQHFEILAFVSRQLKPYDKNYPTHDPYLEVVIFSLNIAGITSMGLMLMCPQTIRVFCMCLVKRI